MIPIITPNQYLEYSYIVFFAAINYYTDSINSSIFVCVLMHFLQPAIDWLIGSLLTAYFRCND